MLVVFEHLVDNLCFGVVFKINIAQVLPLILNEGSLLILLLGDEVLGITSKLVGVEHLLGLLVHLLAYVLVVLGVQVG